jgi:hypothetical protein
LGNAVPLAERQIVERIPICHVDQDGSVRQLTAAGPSLAAHLNHGDAPGGVILPEGSTFSASASWNAGTTPDFAFDGEVAPWSSWNSGLFPTQWIEVDFGSPQRFSVINAVVNQTPDGATVHEVALDGTPVVTWSGTTVMGQVLSHTFPGMQQAQRIRITTTSSPSWVAWFEIQVLGC